ncbi:MAG: sigma 54-interacting transcriptional regulator [Zhaonellaceae bacterium]
MLKKFATHLKVSDFLKEADLSSSVRDLKTEGFQVVFPSTPLSEILAEAFQGKTVYVADEEEKLLGVVDVSKVLKALWQALLVVESQLETLLGTVHDAVTIINDQDEVVGWSRRSVEMYGITPEEILGQKINKFFSSLVVTQVIKNGDVRDSYHQPCENTHVLINASPVKIGGQVIGSLGAERDITETVYLHNELSKASSKVRLLQAEINKITPQDDGFAKIRGKSKLMQEVLDLARRVAKTNASILITGESGTGKELFAEAIHLESRRKEGPFVIVNCDAIPASLFESELFGQRGSLEKEGKLLLAHGGTIFLDEVDGLQPDMQVKLLRALQAKKVYPVGGQEPIAIDVRVIAASSRDLKKLIQQGTFREDLYYQLNVVSLNIPPLRHRKEDIPDLVYALTREFSNAYGAIKEIEPELMTILLNYPWPGNITELRNVVERLVILAEGEALAVKNLPEPLVKWKDNAGNLNSSNLNELTDRTEREVILQALEKVNGNKSQAAKLLGIPRSTLYYKLKALKIL